MPWPDFLNGITVYNREDFRAYFEAALRMRMNTGCVHVYGGGGLIETFHRVLPNVIYLSKRSAGLGPGPGGLWSP